ncbi:NEDD8-conjugating enzyme UBC12-like protein 2 [Stagonosporopsis vannaccii]|nr:NEDD8-conjugating enzyme UBC12-like protein 2 [Stagonosporopsis vannaccii]
MSTATDDAEGRNTLNEDSSCQSLHHFKKPMSRTAASVRAFVPNALQRRLLNDIADFQRNPHANVYLHVDEQDFHKACLILTTEAYGPLHLFIEFCNDFPLRAPTVTIQSDITHPNFYGNYVCASILNTTEGWTPAYTLEGVLVQLLSFFTSESLEQDHGGDADFKTHEYFCNGCGFKPDWLAVPFINISNEVAKASPMIVSKLLALPDEIVLQTLEEMPTKDVLALAEAVPVISNTVNSYDFIRTHELQCFCLKTSYLDAKLGIGISIAGHHKPVLRSEFDLGVRLDKWLPIPLSRQHWNGVKTNATACLHSIHSHARLRSNEPQSIGVLYHLMNNVVVQFSADAEKGFRQPDKRSTLNHASEKAVEAYFACFHLLLCLTTEEVAIVSAANQMVTRFLTGLHTKKEFPTLGYLLVAALISDRGLTDHLFFQITKEAILHNVVWMLDSRGADMAELAYLEPSAVSEYRLLMFLKLFSSSARPISKSLTDLREMLFDSHGAPPPGVSKAMAQRIREIRGVRSFPGFLSYIGINNVPSKTEFTAFLRRTITDSMREREVEVAEGIRVTDSTIEWFNKGEKWYWNGWDGRPNFFPERKEGIRGPRMTPGSRRRGSPGRH